MSGERRVNKIAYLDGLRGLAALAVVLWHFSANFTPFLNAPRQAPATGLAHYIVNYGLAFAYDGNFAVCIFFALSGYVLTIGFFARGNEVNLVRKAAGRYIRLAPLVLVGSLICALLIYFGLYRNNAVHQILGEGINAYHLDPSKLDFTPLGFLKEVLVRTFLVNDESSLFNSVLWTMQIEFRGSFLVFLVAFLAYRIKTALFSKSPSRFGLADNWFMFLAIALIGLMLVLGTHVRGIYFWGMVNGVALAALGSRFTPSRFVLLPMLVLALYLGGDNHGIAYKFINPHLNWICPGNAAQVAHILGASLLLFVVVKSRLLQSLLSRPFPRFLGRVSFSLYLIHGPILYTVICSLFLALNGSLPYPVLVALLFVLTIILVLGAAYVLCLAVDEPSIRWSHQFGRWVTERIYCTGKTHSVATCALCRSVEEAPNRAA